MSNDNINAAAILSVLHRQGGLNKNDIADILKIKGDDRIPLKTLLREMEETGQILKGPGARYTVPAGLPAMSPLVIVEVTMDGDIIATPLDWDDSQGDAPRLEVEANSKDHATLNPDDHILAKITRESDGTYTAKMIRRLDAQATFVVGEVVRGRHGQATIRTLTKRNEDYFDITNNDDMGAEYHDIVRGQLILGRPGTPPRARITEILGVSGDPKILSLMAAHEFGLRVEFPAPVLKESESLPRPVMYDGLTDLRKFPLVTIDGEDARDFDDAVFAQPDPETPGGYHLIVAIADVSYYVRAGTALDDEAYKRGNSTYFADRVLPMLPEGISNDLCSLKPHEDRYCLAVQMWIDKNGMMKRHKFCRGLMKSNARLTYTQVQNARNGLPDTMTKPLVQSVIAPLYDAYALLKKARAARGTLDLEIPERKIVIDESGAMSGIALRERFESHKLIEEFMVLANVAAALALGDKKAPCVYRVHDSPSFEKVENLRNYLATFGVEMPKGSVEAPDQLADILKKTRGQPFSQLVSEQLLRSQMQAHYSTDNIGHFGLALNHYAHFTSPIRRYADLLVHRSLIRAFGLGDGGLTPEDKIKLPAMCEHISLTERASMEAERATVDRFSAAFMADKVGTVFTATIAGVTRFGLFVRLTDTGADGLIPIRILDGDFYHHDERRHALIGARNGRVYRLGAPIMVELIEVTPLAGSMMFRPADDNSADIPGFELDPNERIAPSRFGQHRRGGRHPGKENTSFGPGRGGRSGPPRGSSKGGKSKSHAKKKGPRAR